MISMESLYHSIPEKAKIVTDFIIVPSGFVAGLGTALGLFATAMGGLASAAALVYTVIRIHYFIKDRKAGRK